MHPPERRLTASERSLLPPPFADAIDLDEVRILARWHTPLAALLKVTVVRDARIFWKNAPQEATTLSERAHLAHELVHVWQYRALRRTGLDLLASRTYRYRLYPERAFVSYGYEQQAAIVEDFVRQKNGAGVRWAPPPEASLEAYEQVIASAAGAAP